MIRVVILRHYCDTPAWIAVDDDTNVVEIIVSSKVIIYLSSFWYMFIITHLVSGYKYKHSGFRKRFGVCVRPYGRSDLPLL